MRLSYKYRIYPNQRQIEVLQKNFNFCCFLYNSALQERIDYFKKYGKGISLFTQSAAVKNIRKEFAEQTETIYVQSLHGVLKRVDSAYQNFFRRNKQKSDKVGFPRYKSLDRFKSIIFPQCNLLINGGVKLLENEKLKIFGLPGEVRVKWHRSWKGRCKQVTIAKQSNKFYIILSCDEVPLEPLAKTNKIIALDLGLTTFITSNDGSKIHHPKPYKTAKENLAILNRKLAAKQKGSKNRKKAKQSLARAHEKVSNIRNNFLHQITQQLVKENDVIIIEKLNVKSMLEAKGFEVKKENIQDASWARFASLLTYKAERAGKAIIEVDPKNTSKMCSNCQNIKDNLTLRDREYNCEACGSAMDRDQNAALNIKRLGMSLAIDKFISEVINV